MIICWKNVLVFGLIFSTTAGSLSKKKLKDKLKKKKLDEKAINNPRPHHEDNLVEEAGSGGLEWESAAGGGREGGTANGIYDDEFPDNIDYGSGYGIDDEDYYNEHRYGGHAFTTDASGDGEIEAGSGNIVHEDPLPSSKPPIVSPFFHTTQERSQPKPDDHLRRTSSSALLPHPHSTTTIIPETIFWSSHHPMSSSVDGTTVEVMPPVPPNAATLVPISMVPSGNGDPDSGLVVVTPPAVAPVDVTELPPVIADHSTTPVLTHEIEGAVTERPITADRSSSSGGTGGPPAFATSAAGPLPSNVVPGNPTLGTKPDQITLEDPYLEPGILAAVIGGAVLGLLAAIFLVMFIVYRMRKKDEGSYALDEPKSPPTYPYAYHKAPPKEFYA